MEIGQGTTDALGVTEGQGTTDALNLMCSPTKLMDYGLFTAFEKKLLSMTGTRSTTRTHFPKQHNQQKPMAGRFNGQS